MPLMENMTAGTAKLGFTAPPQQNPLSEQDACHRTSATLFYRDRRGRTNSAAATTETVEDSQYLLAVRDSMPTDKEGYATRLQKERAALDECGPSCDVQG